MCGQQAYVSTTLVMMLSNQRNSFNQFLHVAQATSNTLCFLLFDCVRREFTISEGLVQLVGIFSPIPLLFYYISVVLP